jgi:nucleotide-binding universal stress UspA family protein
MPLFGRSEDDGARVGRVLVATDRSETAERAVAFAADLAARYGAELVLLQVRLPGSPPDPDAEVDLQRHAESLAGERGRGRTVVDADPANAICEASEREDIDLVVVGNVGMSGRKEFLLGNVPNRVSHNVRRNLLIVNTAADLEPKKRGFWR